MNDRCFLSFLACFPHFQKGSKSCSHKLLDTILYRSTSYSLDATPFSGHSCSLPWIYLKPNKAEMPCRRCVDVHALYHHWTTIALDINNQDEQRSRLLRQIQGNHDHSDHRRTSQDFSSRVCRWFSGWVCVGYRVSLVCDSPKSYFLGKFEEVLDLAEEFKKYAPPGERIRYLLRTFFSFFPFVGVVHRWTYFVALREFQQRARRVPSPSIPWEAWRDKDSCWFAPTTQGHRFRQVMSFFFFSLI